MHIAFAGTPDFAVPPLAALLEAGHEIVVVLTQPDRPAGRGQKLAASAVKEFSTARGLKVAQPSTLRTPEGRAALLEAQPDVLIVVAYGLILPAEALAIPRLGCINIHASLLPRWRGAAPVQRAILAGDSSTGVTIMQMDAGLDTGPILAQRSLPISLNDDSASLLTALAALGAPLLIEVLAALETGKLKPEPQPHEGVTYAAKIDKIEARIDWRESAAAIDRRVRAFRPWPIAETRFHGEQVRIHRAAVAEIVDVEKNLDTQNNPPGTILGLHGDALLVACGEGRLGIHQLQRAGRRSMSAREFANGLRNASEVFE